MISFQLKTRSICSEQQFIKKITQHFVALHLTWKLIPVKKKKKRASQNTRRPPSPSRVDLEKRRRLFITVCRAARMHNQSQWPFEYHLPYIPFSGKMLIWPQGLTEAHLRQVGETITRLSNQAWQACLWGESAKHTLSLYRLFCNLCVWMPKDNVTSIWHSSRLKCHVMDGRDGSALFLFCLLLWRITFPRN